MFGKETITVQKRTLVDFRRMKAKGEPVAWITAYDFPLAQCAEAAGVDMILVGDSGGMVQLGYQTTNPVTMDEMITLSKAVRIGAPGTFIVGDMPQGAYEVSKEEAIRSALRFVKEAGCDAVKCEGGRRIVDQVKAMVDAGILVIGHLGLTPQSTASFGGYRVQGKTVASFEETMDDALALQEAGIFALLLEAMPSEPAAKIARKLKIPVYGIGAGDDMDGQLIIMHDLLGLYSRFRPWFAKCYVPQAAGRYAKHIQSSPDLRKLGREERADGLGFIAREAVSIYVDEVRSKVFPGAGYSYPIKPEELEALKHSKYWG
ncbi:MAG: 3-methyl-2-oxobutanoate hydroxymethyltransferase [Spirochaetes bacterium]|nr:3-methyl-2-oxobutanoate hydroxymethyltransferase [Spirochaetota bacterium]